MVLKVGTRLLSFVLVVSVGGCDVGYITGVAGQMVSVMGSTILVLMMCVKCNIFTKFP